MVVCKVANPIRSTKVLKRENGWCADKVLHNTTALRALFLIWSRLAIVLRRNEARGQTGGKTRMIANPKGAKQRVQTDLKVAIMGLNNYLVG